MQFTVQCSLHVFFIESLQLHQEEATIIVSIIQIKEIETEKLSNSSLRVH